MKEAYNDPVDNIKVAKHTRKSTELKRAHTATRLTRKGNCAGIWHNESKANSQLHIVDIELCVNEGIPGGITPF
jgi:hypothetical protein